MAWQPKRKNKLFLADMLLHMVAGMVADMGAGMVVDMGADKKKIIG